MYTIRRNSPHLILMILIVFGALCLPIRAEDEDPTGRGKTIDGVAVEAVETYINTKQHELSLGVGIYPFNPYFDALSFNVGYVYYFTSAVGWEVISFNQAFHITKSLTSELADKYAVNPERIEKLNYVFTTSLVYVFSYGKSLLFRSLIQYFRTSLTLGPAIVKTTVDNYFSGCGGVRFDGYITPAFSWRFSGRDCFAVKQGTNYISFNLGAVASF